MAEISALRPKHKLMIGVGGGTRVRHTVSIALDLGVPTGGVAQLVGAMEEANAVFLNALLAKHRSIVMQREHFWELPLYIENGMLPIVISIPPYHFWEPPPEDGPLPTHGSDFGLFILAEVLGMSRIVFVKDEDGMYTRDPKKHADAKLIRHTTLEAILEENIRRADARQAAVLAWKSARHVERVQIVNGLKRGELTKALAGEDVGTVIDAGQLEGRPDMSDRRLIENALGESALTTERRGLRLPARGDDARHQCHQDWRAVDHGPRARGALPHPRRARRGEGQVQAAPLLRRGTRARHIYAIASDLELPTGVLAALGGYVPAAERPHAADAPGQARGPLHHARRLREAAAVLPRSAASRS